MSVRHEIKLCWVALDVAQKRLHIRNLRGWKPKISKGLGRTKLPDRIEIDQ